MEEFEMWYKEAGMKQLDTETTGLHAIDDSLVCLQIGNQQQQWVFDLESIPLLALKPYLEGKEFLIHNAAFDQSFLMKHGIVVEAIDTFITEKTLNLGLIIPANLKALAYKYCKVDLSKEEQDQFGDKGLTPEGIEYAESDVKWLEEIHRQQLPIAKAKGLERNVDLQNAFTKVIAYTEVCGFHLDTQQWGEKCKEDSKVLLQKREALNNYIVDNNLTQFMTNQLSLFEPPGADVNWNSHTQVKDIFKALGIEVYDKGKLTVNAKAIAHIEHPIVEMYTSYKKQEKLCSTYGENVIKAVNKRTGRIHTKFKQLVDTGRMSSGASDLDWAVNLQNIPKDERHRSCFKAEEGNILLVADYSQQEQVNFADISQIPKLIEFYSSDGADMHSYVVRSVWPELAGLSDEEIKKNHGDKRGEAKKAGFAINYGGDGNTIAANLNISTEEGIRIYDAYMAAFPGMLDYFDEQERLALERGFILIDPKTGAKRWLPEWNEWKALTAKFDDKFWREYRDGKKAGNTFYKRNVGDVRRAFQLKSDIRKKALNTPSQGLASLQTKLGGLYVFDWIYRNDLLGKVKICNIVHDEIVLEAPESMAELAAKEVKSKMERGGNYFLNTLKLKCDPEITKVWKK